MNEATQADSSISRGARYATFLIVIAYAFYYMDRLLLAVLAQPIKQDLHLSDADLGLLSGFAFVAVYAVVGLPVGWLADRVGRRNVLGGCLAIWSVMTAISGVARSFPQLLLARLGVGVGEAGGIPASLALLAEFYPPHRRAVAIAFMSGGAAIGLAAGLGFGGMMAAAYGWRVAFVVAGLPGLLLAVIIWSTMAEPRRADANINPPPFWQTVRMLSRVRTYQWLVLAHIAYSFVTTGFVGWLPLFLVRSHHVAIQKVGVLFGLTFALGAGLGGIGGSWILQRLPDASPARSLSRAGWLLLFSFPAFVGALLASNPYAAVAFLLVFGALAGVSAGPLMAGQQGVVGVKSRALGSAISLFLTGYIGGGLGPLLIGIGSDKLTPSFGVDALRVALLIASAVIVLPAVFLMRASVTYPSDAVS